MSASFDLYKIFYYVGKYKNITHAASALFLSQSTVSRSVQSLESELGCRLFYRTQHGVAFTVEGDVLFKHISKACEQIFMGEDKVARMQQLASGSLRVSVSDFTFERIVLPVVREFHSDFPSVHIELISSGFNDSEAVLSSLALGRVEIACSAAIFPDGSNVGVEITPVAAFSDTVVANSRFSELRFGSYRFSDLASYPFVSLSGYSPYMSYLDRIFLEHGLNVNPEFVVDSISMFMRMVKTCPCLAVIPTPFADEIGDGSEIFEVKMSERTMTHSISLLSSNTAPQSAARDAFLRSLKRYISSNVQGIEQIH